MFTLRLFGGLQLEGPGEGVAGLASRRRPLALLAVLAVAGERGVSRDRMAGLLWGDTDDKHALRSLSNVLYTLRSDLAPDAILGSVTDLHLNGALVESDVQTFQRALERGDRAAAAAVYRGPLLEGFHVPGAQPFEEWLDTERLRCAAQVAAALEHLARAARGAGDLAAAVAWWRRLAAEDPFNSRIAVELARDLAREGDPGNGLQFLREHVALLRSGLDARPDAEVLRTMEELRAGIGGPAAPGDVPRDTAPATPSAASPAEADSGGTPTPAEPGIRGAGTLRRLAGGWRRQPRGVLAGAGLALVAVAAGLGYVGFAGRGEPAPVLGRAVRLTSEPELELDPAISPDGNWVAYVAARPGRNGRLMVRPMAGGRAVRVLGDSVGWEASPVWSPDGQRLLFIAGRGLGAYAAVAPAFGGPMRVLGQCSLAATWSPDGRRYLCPSWEGVLVRAAIDSGPSDTVPSALRYGSNCAWSGAGHIACSSGNIWFRRAGQPESRGNLASSTIWILPAGRGAAVALDTAHALNESPVWSGDGRHLYFVSDRSGQRDVWRYRIGPDGRRAGQPVRLTVGANAMSVSVTPDERTMVWGTFVARTSRIWSAPLRRGVVIDRASGTPVTRVAQGIDEGSPRLSPDGRWITFLSDARGNLDLYRVAVAGGDVEPLSDGPENEGTGDISPDGRELVFYVRRDGSRDVFVRSLASGSVTRLTRTPPVEERLVAWSPDGRAVSAYECCNAEGLESTWVIERDSVGGWRAPRRVVPDRYCPWLRADRLLCTQADTVLAYTLQGVPAETVYVARRGEPRVPGWAFALRGDDGNSVFLRSRADSAIWWVASPGARPVRVARIRDFAIAAGVFAVQGGRLFYTLMDQPETADIWAAPLERRR
jgi:Tol biopolymer transport system component/DNA-binding SARP family transcriptional activator